MGNRFRIQVCVYIMYVLVSDNIFHSHYRESFDGKILCCN